MKKHWLLFPILLLAFFVRMAGWETLDEKKPYLFYEPDEHQHLQLAQQQLAQLSPNLYAPDEVPKNHFNARGFGNQLGLLLWFNTNNETPPSHQQIIMKGRQLSTFFSVCLILVLFVFCYHFFDLNTALFSSFLLAINDLNVTYSHYTIPEAAYIFWLYLFIWSTWLYFRKTDLLKLLFLFFTAAGAFVVKFDFVCFFLALGIIYWPKINQSLPPFVRVFFGVTFAFLFFQLLCAFNFNWEELTSSWRELRSQNQNAVPEDNHWLHNPIVYFIGIVATLGLPAFLVASFGLSNWVKKWSSFSKNQINTLLVLAILMALEIGARWSIDTPFIRRINFIMPALCMLAGYQLATWWEQKRFKIIAIGVCLYSFVYLFASQINHWKDPRYAARDFIQKAYTDESISYSGYVQTKGMPPSKQPLAASNIYVIHETFYQRYGKSFTTPFKIPKCCEEVYHCYDKTDECTFVQTLLAGTNEDFTLEKAFRTKEIFPERMFYHYLFGHFETFRGDVLIFRRNR